MKLHCLNALLLLLLTACKGDAPPPPMHVVDSAVSADGVPIRYEARGRGSPALVFVHGWQCDRTYWSAQVPHFAQRYRVVTIDLAGHGDSGTNRGTWSMSAFGDDVAAVVRALDLDAVVLIGHSMGGPVIVEAARKLGDAVVALVAVDTFHDLDEPMGEDAVEQFLEDFRADFRTNVGRVVRQYMFLPQTDTALVNRIASDMASGAPEIGISNFEAYFDWLRNDARAAFAGVRVPVRAINAQHEQTPTDIAALRRFAPGAEVQLMTGVGHFLMMEKPEEFNRLLDEVVREVAEI